MSEDLVELAQSGLLLRFSDGVWRNDLVLQKWTQLNFRYLYQQADYYPAEQLTHSYTCGQAWVRPGGQHVDGEGDGEAWQTSVHQSIPG